jgi:hypothetical protein
MSPSTMALEAMSYPFLGGGAYVHGGGLVEFK